jgi:dihydroneopterin aldolase
LIAEDGMQHVFDYDPLIAEIERLASACYYETQERLLTCIAQACASYVEIHSVNILLRKSPLGNGSGSLGVRIILDKQALNKF